MIEKARFSSRISTSLIGAVPKASARPNVHIRGVYLFFHTPSRYNPSMKDVGRHFCSKGVHFPYVRRLLVNTTMSCTYQLNENSLSLSVQTIMSLGKTWTNETNGRGAGISVLTPGANWVRAKTSDELFPHTAVHCLWKMSFKPNSGIIRVGRRTHVPQGSRYGSLPGNMQEELLFAAER